MSEPENIVLMLLREIRREISEVRDYQGHLATNLAVADLRKDMAESETRLKERISGLQRAVMEYHS